MLPRAADCEPVTTAILRRYKINIKTYWQRFRSASRKSGEMGCQLVMGLQDSARKWMKGQDTKEDVLDVLIMEQFLTAQRDTHVGEGEEADVQRRG